LSRNCMWPVQRNSEISKYLAVTGARVPFYFGSYRTEHTDKCGFERIVGFL